MATVSSTTVIFLLKSALLLTTLVMIILCICTTIPCYRVIVERAVLFTAIPAPTPSTPSLLVESLCIEPTGKNIGTGIIL